MTMERLHELGLTLNGAGSEPPKPATCEQHGDFESRNVFGSVWSRCPVCAEEAEQARQQRQRMADEEARNERWQGAVHCAGIPPRFTTRTLDNFIATSQAQKAALTFAQDMADELVSRHQTGRCAVFVGKPGTGKTHLAVGIGMHALKARHTVLFTTVTRLIRRIRDTYNKGNEETELQAVSVFTKPYLLILDEIGVQRGTDDEKLLLFDVLNDRYENQRSTILLSNLPAKELRGYLGDRVFDRLKEDGGQVVVFDWESRRGQIGGVE